MPTSTPTRPWLTVGAPIAVVDGSINHRHRRARLTTITRVGTATFDVGSGERFRIATLEPAARQAYPFTMRAADPAAEDVTAMLRQQRIEKAHTAVEEAIGRFARQASRANSDALAAAAGEYSRILTSGEG